MAREPHDFIIVTNWEKVEKDDFYLSKDWEKQVGQETIRKARRLQKQDDLFKAYRVAATTYLVCHSMDAHGILIDSEGNEIVSCETDVIGNDFKEVWEDDENL